MIRFTIRPAHESEHRLVRDSWTRSFDEPHVRNIAGQATRYMRYGGDGRVVAWAHYEMHRGWVKSKWDELSILVATLPGHDEAAGWCAVTLPGEHPLVVHYVYTVDVARLKGVARQLLEAALKLRDGRPPRFTHMTTPMQNVVEQILTAERAHDRAEAAMR